jgi:hypothetical protein
VPFAEGIRIALGVLEAELDSEDAYSKTFESIEELGLESVPYKEVIDEGRAFSAQVAAEFLNVLVHSYHVDATIVRDAPKWLIHCNDEYLVEIALRLHLSLRTGFFKRRLRRALATAKDRYPQLRQLICKYEESDLP